MPKEQRHAARSEVSKYRDAKEAGDGQTGDGERQEDRNRRVAEERQDEPCGHGPGSHVPHHPRGKAGFVHAYDEDRHAEDKGERDPDRRHTQGRKHRPDRGQAQDRHEPVGKPDQKVSGTWKVVKEGFCTSWKQGQSATCYRLVPNSLIENRWSVMKGAVTVASWTKPE